VTLLVAGCAKHSFYPENRLEQILSDHDVVQLDVSALVPDTLFIDDESSYSFGESLGRISDMVGSNGRYLATIDANGIWYFLEQNRRPGVSAYRFVAD